MIMRREWEHEDFEEAVVRSVAVFVLPSLVLIFDPQHHSSRS
jgi:hypothetical protein